jgi:hypothetical protein
VRLGTENRKKTIWAVALGVLALLAVVYEVIPMFSGPGPTPVAASQPVKTVEVEPVGRRGTGPSKKAHAPANLDPTLRLDLLAASEGTMYEGSGRNIFVSQAEVVIPKPIAPGSPDATTTKPYITPSPPPPLPIPLKFFGFASRPGEPKRIFLSKNNEDVFIAGEGDIVDRRYKIVRISPNSVEIQDVVGSGPAQNIPLTQNL